MDFQRVKLVEPLKDKYDNWTNKDTDGDGVLDRNELGDDSSDSNNENSLWTKVDITKFIKKSVEKELYGNDIESINSTDGKLMIDNAMAQVKYNIYKERQKFIEEHPDDNICDRKEDKENYLNIDAVTESRVSGKSDAEIREEMKKDSAKLQVRLWKYKLNPVLKDTDFDGIDDNEDKVTKDNHFTGRMNTTRLSGNDAIEVDMTMDYRYFFLSNKLYYDELSTMSLLYANSVYMRNSGISVYSDNNPTFSNLRIKDLMEFYGFKDVRTYYMGSPGDDGDENKEYFTNNFSEVVNGIRQINIPQSEKDTNYTNNRKIGTKYRNIDEIYLGYKDTHKGRVALGHKTIECHGLYKTVIGIVKRGTAEDDDWDSDFDMGDIKLKEKFNKSI